MATTFGAIAIIPSVIAGFLMGVGCMHLFNKWAFGAKE